MNNKLIVCFVLGALAQLALAIGDRKPGLNCIYPEDAFYHNNERARILDVTQEPFFAKGDGVTDDTAAFIRAYDFVAEKLRPTTYKNPHNLMQASFIIYVPNGEYLVSDTIIHSSDMLVGNDLPHVTIEGLTYIRFIGQSREKTIVRLKDSSPGFEAGMNKPVFSYAKGEFNNWVAYNSFRNITIDTGKGNPGAIGLEFCGANNSSISNVCIRSGDGTGYAGLNVRVPPAMGYHSDISVEGFDYGIRLSPYHMTHFSFEHLTLENQNKAGILIVDSSASIRDLLSNNNAPAIQMSGEGSQAVVIDSTLKGSPALPAVDRMNGQLFARNVVVEGYKGLADGVTGRHVKEYLFGEAFTLFEGEQPRSLDLPIVETPLVPWEQDMDQWANVDDFGANGWDRSDDTSAIQKAMDSGKSTIYFPGPEYAINGTVDIPASVKRILFLYGGLITPQGSGPGSMLRVSGFTDDPLIIEDLKVRKSKPVVSHACLRPLVLSNIGGTSLMYQNLNTELGALLFLNNCVGVGKPNGTFRDMTVYARFINTEFKKGINFKADNSLLWIFGYKVEGHQGSVGAFNGSKVEVLGGMANEHAFSKEHPPSTTIVNDNSDLSFIGCTNGPGKFIDLVEETRETETRKLKNTDLPVRKGKYRDVYIPLYVGRGAN